MYEQYNAEKVMINGDKLAVIKDYAANFESFTDNQAQTLVNKWAQADPTSNEIHTNVPKGTARQEGRSVFPA